MLCLVTMGLCINCRNEPDLGEADERRAEKQFKNFESMINSMTLEERSNPDLAGKGDCWA